MTKLFRRTMGGQATFDFLAWIGAVFLAALMRLESEFASASPNSLFVLGLLLGLSNFIGGKVSGLYKGRFKPASFGELVSLLVATSVTSVAFSLVLFLYGLVLGIPRSLAILAALVFLLFSGASRAYRRYLLLVRDRPTGGKRTLIYGAGHMAEAVIPQLLGDQNSEYLPVGLVDDDPNKATRWISGVRMKGSFEQLDEIARSTQSTVLLVAISRVDSKHLQRIYSAARHSGLEVVVLPDLNELLTNGGKTLNLKTLSIEELIGRRAVATDSSLISEHMRGKTVLVTGAGGSIGSELCRQIAQLAPGELVFLDRDETGLQQAQLVTYGQGLLDSASLVLADIREKDVLEKVFARVKPDIVFHAAALKHLPVLEKHPEEAWKTNVLGTLNVLEAAANANVRVFVNISTDKAADPSSVLGRSKLIGEKLTSGFAKKNGARFVSVRFGNVLGSRGSLVPTLATLIERGGPITITHPDATRYFMTTPEACQLVLHSMVLEGAGDVFVLDMGEPVKILDVAQRMIELAGSHAEIVFTGLRLGEKLDEKLHSSGTTKEDTTHPLIWQMKSGAVEVDWVHTQTHEILVGQNLKP